MQKDFWKWHAKKELLNDTEGTALFHEREIWWCALGANIGFEQDGSSDLFTRPVVILTKFNLDACLVVPLTSRAKKGTYYFPVGDVDGRDATAVLWWLRASIASRNSPKSKRCSESNTTARHIDLRVRRARKKGEHARVPPRRLGTPP